MRFAFRLTLVLVCGATFALTPAADAREKSKDETIVKGKLGAELDERVTDKVPEFWGSVLVAKKGKVLLAKGYGMADYENKPNTARTLHELASASKQVAGTAILHLQQRRKLKIGDSIGKYFKKVPKEKKAITIRHLLTHTSGISREAGVSYASPIDRKNYVKQMMAESLDSKPGETYAYSNVGYALLAAIVEQVSKMTYEEYVEKYLFKPAGLKDTGFVGDKDLQETGRASVRKGRLRGKTAADWHYGWGYRGMGGVVTSVLDLLKWDQALRDDTILKEEARGALYKPYKNFYACGWQVDHTDRGTRRVHHSGGVEGYGTNVIRYLEDDVCVFVLSNKGDSAHKVSAALEAVLFKPTSIQVSIDVTPYGGGGRTLKTPTSLTWGVSRKGRDLVIEVLDKKTVVLGLRLPKKTYGKKLLFELEHSIQSRESDEKASTSQCQAELYLGGYGRSAKIVHPFGQVRFAAEHRGRTTTGEPKIDRRVTLVLTDTRSGGMTGVVLMNLISAKALLEKLSKAVR